jgi:hypothetical protein
MCPCWCSSPPKTKSPAGSGRHVTDTECRPDFTAAFGTHWGDEATTLWPCIRLVGEDASLGKSKKSQTMQATCITSSLRGLTSTSGKDYSSQKVGSYSYSYLRPGSLANPGGNTSRSECSVSRGHCPGFDVFCGTHVARHCGTEAWVMEVNTGLFHPASWIHHTFL